MEPQVLPLIKYEIIENNILPDHCQSGLAD